MALGNDSAIKATLYDSSKLPNLREGTSVILKNYTRRQDGSIILGSTTQVFRADDIAVSPETQQEGINIVSPPDADFVPISSAKTSPVKMSLSLKGYVIQVNTTKNLLIAMTIILRHN